MGYHTEFEGSFDLNRPLAKEHHAYLSMFSQTRRMKLNAVEVAKLPDPIRESANLPIGEDACNFVGDNGKILHYSFMGESNDEYVVDYNKPPASQPGLWCQWTPNEDGTSIEWNCGEKFYHYIEWIEYLIVNFLTPWGYTLNGQVSWRGENFTDVGTIMVTDNVVTTKMWAI